MTYDSEGLAPRSTTDGGGRDAVERQTATPVTRDVRTYMVLTVLSGDGVGLGLDTG